MIKALIGRYVVARSNMSGVWFGKLTSVEPVTSGGWACSLENATKVHAWSNTAATSGLAHRGPGADSRLCQPVEFVAVDCACELILASPAAIETFKNAPRWDFPQE